MAAGLAGSHACWPKFVYCRGHGLVGNSSGQEPRYRGRGDEASEPASDGCPPGSPSLLPLRALRSFARLPLLRPTANLGLSPERAPCSGALAQHPRPARPYHFLHRLRPSMTLAPPPPTKKPATPPRSRCHRGLWDSARDEEAAGSGHAQWQASPLDGCACLAWRVSYLARTFALLSAGLGLELVSDERAERARPGGPGLCAWRWVQTAVESPGQAEASP